MLEVQAVIGRIQLQRMSGWTEARKRNTAAITAACSGFNLVRTPEVPDYMEHAYYKHYCFVEPSELAAGWTRDRVVEEINAQRVPCYQGTCSEVYLEKAFD